MIKLVYCPRVQLIIDAGVGGVPSIQTETDAFLSRHRSVCVLSPEAVESSEELSGVKTGMLSTGIAS